MVKTINNGEKRQLLTTYLFSSKKYEENVPVINNDGEHTRKIEDS